MTLVNFEWVNWEIGWAYSDWSFERITGSISLCGSSGIKKIHREKFRTQGKCVEFYLERSVTTPFSFQINSRKNQGV